MKRKQQKYPTNCPLLMPGKYKASAISNPNTSTQSIPYKSFQHNPAHARN